MAITTHEHHGHGDHGHDHEGAVGPHTHLTSVGIDIGSSTSHLMFSQLLIGYPSVLQRKPIVLERNVIARSPILLTPFSGDWNIEAGPLKELVDDTFQEAGLIREDIDTGAVIIEYIFGGAEVVHTISSTTPPVKISTENRYHNWLMFGYRFNVQWF